MRQFPIKVRLKYRSNWTKIKILKNDKSIFAIYFLKVSLLLNLLNEHITQTAFVLVLSICIKQTIPLTWIWFPRRLWPNADAFFIRNGFHFCRNWRRCDFSMWFHHAVHANVELEKGLHTELFITFRTVVQ